MPNQPTKPFPKGLNMMKTRVLAQSRQYFIKNRAHTERSSMCREHVLSFLLPERNIIRAIFTVIFTAGGWFTRMSPAFNLQGFVLFFYRKSDKLYMFIRQNWEEKTCRTIFFTIKPSFPSPHEHSLGAGFFSSQGHHLD